MAFLEYFIVGIFARFLLAFLLDKLTKPKSSWVTTTPFLTVPAWTYLVMTNLDQWVMYLSAGIGFTLFDNLSFIHGQFGQKHKKTK